MKVYYRISDKGNPKEKISRADKFFCLTNAMNEFGKESLFIIADNCNEDTVSFIKRMGARYEETSLGNSASFRHMLEIILSSHEDSESVYLLEDDYVHLEGSAKLLIEGLKIADYVTLYDHPDKYKLAVDHGNPFNAGRIHATRILLTEHAHWAEVNSTTMTFATRVGTLREDQAVWLRNTVSRNPKDFRAFVRLTQKNPIDAWRFLFTRKKKLSRIILSNFLLRRKMRKVISCIPAKATHAETRFLAPVIDWHAAIEALSAKDDDKGGNHE